jgi:hypothetical protein
VIGAVVVFGASVFVITYINPHGPAPASPLAPGLHAPLASAHSLDHDPSELCNHLYRTVCQKRGETRDPTGVVRPDVDGEIQALRTYEEIIHQHPDWESEQVDQELVNTIFTPKRRARVESAYHWVEHVMEQFINRQPESVFTRSEKKQLKQRLRKTELQLPPPVSMYADEPDLFTKNDVFYERMLNGQMRMRVGGAYLLNAKSWFNLVFTLGHELGHAIDPCELRAARLAIPAYDRISACFLAHGLTAARTTRRECGENDQLSETFADWMAVQMVSEALRSFATEFHGNQLVSAASNSVRDLCEQDETGADELDLEFHPSPEVRINQIFARNPGIREVLGCTALTPENDPYPEYCGFNYVPPQFTPPSNPAAPASPAVKKMLKGIHP